MKIPHQAVVVKGWNLLVGKAAASDWSQEAGPAWTQGTRVALGWPQARLGLRGSFMDRKYKVHVISSICKDEILEHWKVNYFHFFFRKVINTIIFSFFCILGSKLTWGKSKALCFPKESMCGDWNLPHIQVMLSNGHLLK